MAKKTKKAKKAAKAGKAAIIPKKIGGMKVPKEMREQGENLLALARNPVVADVLTAGLVAVASRIRNGDRKQRPATDVPATRETAPRAREPNQAASAIVDAFAARLSEGMDRLFEAARDGIARETQNGKPPSDSTH